MPDVNEAKEIAGVYVVRLDEHPDDRGRFLETYRRTWITGANEMVQANRSESRPGTLRGMHYHLFQADYWNLISGNAIGVLYDFRSSSQTFKATMTIDLAPEIGLYIPPGVAHGFYAFSDTVLTYLVDQVYDGSDELGIAFDDPELGVDWPEGDRLVSDRDRSNPRLADIAPENRPS